MSIVIDIAEAVTAQLNAPDSPLAGLVTARRVYKPSFDLPAMKDLQVSVVPRGLEMTGATRSLTRLDVQIDIGIQHKPPTLDDAALDGLMDLTAAIADHLRGRVLAQAPAAAWVATANAPIYAPEHLEQLRQFTSVLTVTYRLLR